MKLYTFIDEGKERIGAETTDGGIVDLAAVDKECAYFSSMLDLIKGGEEAVDRARAIIAQAPASALRDLSKLKLAPPIPRPPKFRGHSVFETHIKQSAEGVARMMAAAAPDAEAAYQKIRKDMNLDKMPGPAWYETPANYLMDHTALVGHDATVTWPSYSNWIDYELELVAVIGRPGKDIKKENAFSHIFGYTIFNDLSARDAQLKAMGTGLGAGKGKDFDGSNPVGPCIVTADEIPDPYALNVRVLINGEVWSKSDGRTAHFKYDDCIAYGSQSQMIASGELISTGTFPNCSSIELQKVVKRGDTIELEVEGIGTLRTRIA
jgi:2-keto-4-pentenoate hydratase/2-oxohepta-3-ene-1,7-dioic acid hydratase in catechol pathway